MGIALCAYPLFVVFSKGNQVPKIIVTVVLSFYGLVFYASNFRFLAEKIFVQPKSKKFSTLTENKVNPKQLVLGISINNQSKAYPIEIIGYHHQVRDTLAGQPVMVTYCTVCRSGRVYNRTVNGLAEEFRLVGMDHYNAMFEDKSTRSWWRQVSGEAVVGPLKGSTLSEIPSEQMTLMAWGNQHPETLILQPDTLFKEGYAELGLYDEGKMEGRLESKDSLSWRDKSWVVGVQLGGKSRAYDWGDLQKFRLLEDTLNATPLLVVMEPDSASFHVLSRVVNGDTLSFAVGADGRNMQDKETKSIWNWDGRCNEGELKGNRLPLLQSYQEYWHSWRMFKGGDTFGPSPTK
jgi:Protein of unknown function (DUF3179)